MSGRPETSGGQEATKLKGFDDFELRLGDIMRGERATMGKSLLDVQRELKIKANYIAAIENSDPSAFETPGFIAGYVRSYARYLGLDPEWAFKTFCEEGEFVVSHGMSADASVNRKTKKKKSADGTGGKTPAHMRDPFTEPSVSYLPKAEAALSGFEPRAIGSIAVLLVLLGGIGYGGWAVLQEVQKVTFTPVDQTPEVLAELDPLTPAVTPAGDDAEAAPDLGSVGRFDRLYRPEALDVPVMVARDGPIASIDPDTIGALAPAEGSATLAANLPQPDNLPFGLDIRSDRGPAFARLDQNDLLPPPPAVQVVEPAAPSLELLAVRPSWVRVRAADGTVIFEKILDAGEQFEVPLTEEPATLRAGNAGSLYFAINGETFGPAGSGPEVVKDLVLAPDALVQSYQVADVERDADLARFVAVAEAQGTE
ncbi:MAG: helix-turn-helix domain-containing protein [Paracoccaceae bacterium]|nr:helix-turn-helix domain-containing protein [Paracoccaceae bacterium]